MMPEQFPEMPNPKMPTQSVNLDQLAAENARALHDANTISILIQASKQLHADNVILANRLQEAAGVLQKHAEAKAEPTPNRLQ